jgi:hypothetical protein
MERILEIVSLLNRLKLRKVKMEIWYDFNILISIHILFFIS